jgi:hypothetical protein
MIGVLPVFAILGDYVFLAPAQALEKQAIKSDANGLLLHSGFANCPHTTPQAGPSYVRKFHNRPYNKRRIVPPDTKLFYAKTRGRRTGLSSDDASLALYAFRGG